MNYRNDLYQLPPTKIGVVMKSQSFQVPDELSENARVAHDPKGALAPESILNDPSASNWLREALTSALERDPMDAANDAEVLAAILSERAAQHLPL